LRGIHESTLEYYENGKLVKEVEYDLESDFKELDKINAQNHTDSPNGKTP